MAEETVASKPAAEAAVATELPAAGVADIETATGPHIVDRAFTTRRMMYDVLIGLVPIFAAAVWFFRGWAVLQVAVALVVAFATEALFCVVRKKKLSLADGSVAITAIILAFSLPPTLPIYATVLGTFAAVALGKMVFGGLGHNIFNPAMVGRAVLMACFSAQMTTWAYPATDPKPLETVTSATPLKAAIAKAGSEARLPDLMPLIQGNTSGSLGETSAAMIALGGLWLLIRKAGDWRLTAGMLLGMAIPAAIIQIRDPHSLGVIGHLASGGAMLAAFFIVTDPVTTPLTKAGRWIFGLGVGGLIILIRLYSNLPEGVLYAVLVMNAITPLLNRWTAPKPVGGKTAPVAM
jgi:electron transport complex protein RnfD